jgi:hypothetical protein
VTDNWIPIKTLSAEDESDQWDVQTAATPGQLLRVVVTDVAASTAFSYAHEGTLEVIESPANAVKITTSGEFPWDEDGYAGYQLRVTSEDGSVEEVFDVVSNEASGGNKYVTVSSSISSVDFSGDSTYKLLPKITITSNGDSESPIDVIPTLNVDNKIQSFTIVSGGEGASSVTIAVVAPTGVNSFVSPTIRCVLDSFRGLGKDPEKDLGASFVMVATKIKYDEEGNDFTKSNDYRQIGIIKGVYNGANLASDSTLRPTKKLTVAFIDGAEFNADSELTLLNSDESEIGHIRVLDFDSATNQLTFIQTEDTGYTSPAVGNIIDDGSGTKANITSISSSEVTKLKGDILYLENRRPVIRAEGQTEEIKTIIEF